MGDLPQEGRRGFYGAKRRNKKWEFIFFWEGWGGWEINTGKEEEGLNGGGIEIKRTGRVGAPNGLHCICV